MAGPSDGLPTNTATILYQRCVILSQTHLGRIKANPYWQHDQQQILRQSIARLILWGEDLCEGELERCLAHSSSLKHAVLEVLSSLGTALVNGTSPRCVKTGNSSLLDMRERGTSRESRGLLWKTC
jgi:hypothetical protein